LDHQLSLAYYLGIGIAWMAYFEFIWIVVYRWLDQFTVQPITAYEVPE